MNFFINKNSTLPELIMELVCDGRNDYKSFHEQIQNADITFSMYDVNTGAKKISCKPTSILMKDTGCDLPEEYYIVYQFSERETSKPGTYKGEFSINFLDGSGFLKAPIQEELFIHIL